MKPSISRKAISMFFLFQIETFFPAIDCSFSKTGISLSYKDSFTRIVYSFLSIILDSHLLQLYNTRNKHIMISRYHDITISRYPNTLQRAKNTAKAHSTTPTSLRRRSPDPRAQHLTFNKPVQPTQRSILGY